MEKILIEHPWIIVVILIWTFPWKAAALWKSARRGHMGWFFTLMIFNTLAILDILYIFFFAGPSQKEKNDQQQDEVRQAKMQRFREQQTRKMEMEQQLQEQQVLQQQEMEISQIAIKKVRRRQTII